MRNISELSDQDLVARCKELKGMATLEKNFTKELRARLDAGKEIAGVEVAPPTEQTRVIGKADLLDLLQSLGIDDVDQFFKTISVSGKIKFHD